MPVDYSKWDALELSDDSDIEVHPNVDKRSFIRAKQNQIHMERQQRRLQIETLKYERQINDALARRIDGLLARLRAHADEARASIGGGPDSRSDSRPDSDPNAAGAVAFRAVMESAAQIKPEDDRPPKPPAGVHSEPGQPDTYTQMMAALLDQVNRALSDEERQKKQLPPLVGAARYDAMLDEIASHSRKVAGLQQELLAKLAELEHEEARKITSDSIHTGFDSSHVNKTSNAGEAGAGGQPELLNPNYRGAATDGIPWPASTSAPASASSGTPPADNNNDNDDDDETPVSASEIARQFARIPPSHLSESQALIRAHPQLVASDKDMEGILMMAFDAEFEEQPEIARRYVHQATLLEFCRALGRDGVDLFFRRMATDGHSAQDVFRRDVQEKYSHIRKRTREINAQKAANAAAGNDAADGVEQIQLHAVEPGTVINIHIPPAGTEAELGPEVFHARQIFEGFQPDMKAALESGSLDRVNTVLGRMPVAEAEALVGEFSEAGILSMEDEIIDATTEEGRQQLKEMGRDEEGGPTTKESPDKPKEKEDKEDYPDPE